jgi:hypothetical protein
VPGDLWCAPEKGQVCPLKLLESQYCIYHLKTFFKLVPIYKHSVSRCEALCACRSAVFTTVVRQPCMMKLGFTLRRNVQIWNLEIQGFFPTVTIFTTPYYVHVPMDSWDMNSVPMQRKGWETLVWRGEELSPHCGVVFGLSPRLC